MKTYYKDEWVTLYHGDNRPILAGLADQSIDLVATDTPYATTALLWDQPVDWQWCWAELHRLCKPSALQVLFSAQPFTTDLINSNRANWRYELIWHKTMATRYLDANRRPLAAHENIQVFCRDFGSSTYNPQKIPRDKPTRLHRAASGSSAEHYNLKTRTYDTEVKTHRHPVDVLQYSNGHGGASDHPTAKPIELMCWIVASYSNPGDLILDPFGGSGTTAAAAKRLGRRCIIIEQEEKYCEIAARRLAQDCMNLEAA